MKAERVPIDSVELYPENVRIHDEANIRKIMGSLKSFKQQTPIVIAGDSNYIVKGNGTWKAAKRMDFTHIWILKSDLCGDLAKAYSIADNATSDSSEFDWLGLSNQLRELEQTELNLEEVTGMDSFELSTLIDSAPYDPNAGGKGDDSEKEQTIRVAFSEVQYQVVEKAVQIYNNQQGKVVPLADALHGICQNFRREAMAHARSSRTS